MKARKIIVCIVIAVLQLAAMCAFGVLFDRTVAAFSSYLVFVCCSTGITAIVLSGRGRRQAGIGAVCVFIGLFGIAAMSFCHILIQPPLSGIVGFVVFLVFAGIIAIILMSQREYFKDDYSRLHDHSRRESALHLVRILRSQGIAGNEIRSIIRERFRFDEGILDDLSEPEYRARISLYAGLLINFAYIVFKAGLGIYYRSVWYGAVAVYYLVLFAIRFFLVQSDRKTLTEEQALYRYRLTGLSMLFLNMAMAGMMIQMIWYGKGYSYPGFVIYASAAYTFYVVVTAVINAVKFHKHKYNHILSATKMLNFTAALMSLLALQTAMLTQFGNDGNFNNLMNAVTGANVTVLTMGMSAFMVIHGNKALKKCRKECDIESAVKAAGTQ